MEVLRELHILGAVDELRTGELDETDSNCIARGRSGIGCVGM